MKDEKQPITMLTAYDFPTAKKVNDEVNNEVSAEAGNDVGQTDCSSAVSLG